MKGAQTKHATIQAEEDFEKINRLWQEKSWDDGLPVVPPTKAAVSRMLEFCPSSWGDTIATMPPRWGEVTPIRVASNAVMAGCRPEYFPIVMAAVRAMCADEFNLFGIQTTTHQCAPLVIVNGPIGRELRINSGLNAFGPGQQANATIGRAIRLVLLNIGGGIPGTGDMATFGSPAKYAFCVAENEVESPWEPLHVELGFPTSASTVTVVGCEGPHNISDHESLTADGILRTIANSMAIPGCNNATAGNINFVGQPLVVLGPEHAALISKGGYSKSEVKAKLHREARVPVRNFSDESIERRLRNSGRFEDQASLPLVERRVPLAKSSSDFMVIVLGGAGKHSAFMPTFGATQSVTEPLKREDGSFATSINDFHVPVDKLPALDDFLE